MKNNSNNGTPEASVSDYHLLAMKSLDLDMLLTLCDKTMPDSVFSKMARVLLAYLSGTVEERQKAIRPVRCYEGATADVYWTGQVGRWENGGAGIKVHFQARTSTLDDAVSQCLMCRNSFTSGLIARGKTTSAVPRVWLMQAVHEALHRTLHPLLLNGRRLSRQHFSLDKANMITRDRNDTISSPSKIHC